MNTKRDSANPVQAGILYRGLARWALRLVVAPLGWLLLFTAMRGWGGLIYFLVLVLYLCLLIGLSLTTMFAERRFEGRLRRLRLLLSVSGSLAMGGLLLLAYGFNAAIIIYGPDELWPR